MSRVHLHLYDSTLATWARLGIAGVRGPEQVLRALLPGALSVHVHPQQALAPSRSQSRDSDDFEPGQRVTTSGYPAVIVRRYSAGMYEVRLTSRNGSNAELVVVPKEDIRAVSQGRGARDTDTQALRKRVFEIKKEMLELDKEGGLFAKRQIANLQRELDELFDKLGVRDARNHLGERSFQTFAAWRAAIKSKYPNARFEGDKDIASAFSGSEGVGEWDGDQGSMYYDSAHRSTNDCACTSCMLKVVKDAEAVFSPAQIESLRSEYSRINTIDPAGESYPKLISFLGRLSQAQLKQLSESGIKFISGLARNRVR